VIEDNAVVHDVVYPSSPERVWRALVDPDELAAWLMPSQGFEPVEGNRFTMACDPFGEISGQVLEVVPELRLTLRWIGSFGDTTVAFELEPDPAGTRLRVTHSGWTSATRVFRDQFGSGWKSKLTEGLTAVLA
jgi:uncharacterized protein YndB with AHSA1/START domain